MRSWSLLARVYAPLVIAALISTIAAAQQGEPKKKAEKPDPPIGFTDTPFLPDGKWRVGDIHRPRPAIVKPGEPGGLNTPAAPPADAVVLFDGADLSKWKASGRKDKSEEPGWKVENGYMEITPNSGNLSSRDEFGDCQLHIEWATPAEVVGKSQGRGNSGVILMGKYEVQVLDSHDNITYADGQAASIYGQYPPQVNVSRKPGEWQSYDIVFEAPLFEDEKVKRPAYLTVFHNGVLVQNRREVLGPMTSRKLPEYKPHPAQGPLMLQNHGNPVRYRNIWMRRLRGNGEPFAHYPGQAGPGQGKKIVFLSGDEEYRSEEACPMLAKILAERHGFDSTVLFSIDPETGTIDPNNQTNIPHLDALADADLMVVFLRFRELPDEQMKHVADYLAAGKPVIALRTSTHAFAYSRQKDSPFAKWSYNSQEWPGGFGRQVLGETWVSHHGKHKFESTRGVVNKKLADAPILRGVQDVWGPTDVYGITKLPDDAQVLLYGQVLTGMNPTDPPVDGPQNDPMMPIAWTRVYAGEGGQSNKVFCTTMGASIDLVNEDLRRLLVNACYWATGLEDKIPDRANVDIVGAFQPTFYGFVREPNHYRNLGLRPSDYEGN